MVVAVCLLVKIPEQVEWFDTHVGSVQTTLQQAPEVLHAVSVDPLPDIGFSVVDDFMIVFGLQPVVALEFVGEQLGTSLYVATNKPLELFFFGVFVTTAVRTSPPRSRTPATMVLSTGPRPWIFSRRFFLCMLRAFAANEGLISLYLSGKFIK